VPGCPAFKRKKKGGREKCGVMRFSVPVNGHKMIEQAASKGTPWRAGYPLYGKGEGRSLFGLPVKVVGTTLGHFLGTSAIGKKISGGRGTNIHENTICLTGPNWWSRSYQRGWECRAKDLGP